MSCIQNRRTKANGKNQYHRGRRRNRRSHRLGGNAGAEQRRAASTTNNQLPLPDPAPNYDAELAAICRKVRDRKATRFSHAEFEEFHLSDDGKSLEELDADYAAFERLGQYDENGVIGFSMSAGQRAVVVFDFAADVDASYLPPSADALAQKIFLVRIVERALVADRLVRKKIPN